MLEFKIPFDLIYQKFYKYSHYMGFSYFYEGSSNYNPIWIHKTVITDFLSIDSDGRVEIVRKIKHTK